MAKTPASQRPAPRPRTQQASAAPAPRLAASPSQPDGSVLFPFARTTEDDELRDLSGYGWGV